MTLAVSTDMLVEGRHFLSTVAPDRLGHKALAVNLSDLAACGAQPLAFTLALALPRADEAFLAAFARGLFALADREACELIGGDTTRGPLADLHHRVRRAAAPARRCCARARGPATTSTSAARSATRAWRSRSFRGQVALDGDAFAQVRRAMELPAPRVGARHARCAAWRPARSTSPTAWPATSATCCAAPASAPSSRSTPCRAAPCSPRSRWRCSASACSPAATTTSSSSPRCRRVATPSPPRPRGRRRRGHAHRPHRGRRRACASSIAAATRVASQFGSFDHFRA